MPVPASTLDDSLDSGFARSNGFGRSVGLKSTVDSSAPSWPKTSRVGFAEMPIVRSWYDSISVAKIVGRATAGYNRRSAAIRLAAAK